MDIDATQFIVVQCIVAHPEERPSLDDLDQMNPSLGVDAIRHELHELARQGVVDQINVNEEKRYRLTNKRRGELEGTGLFDAADTLKHYYGQTR